eukprot:580227-Prymnesium_polylepis.1
MCRGSREHPNTTPGRAAKILRTAVEAHGGGGMGGGRDTSTGTREHGTPAHGSTRTCAPLCSTPVVWRVRTSTAHTRSGTHLHPSE